MCLLSCILIKNLSYCTFKAVASSFLTCKETRGKHLRQTLANHIKRQIKKPFTFHFLWCVFFHVCHVHKGVSFKIKEKAEKSDSPMVAAKWRFLHRNALLATLHLFIATLFLVYVLPRTRTSLGRHARFSKGRLRDVPEGGLSRLCRRLSYCEQNSYFPLVH